MFTTVPTDYITVKEGDALFTFSPDGFTIVPRASIVVDPSCPSAQADIIVQAYNRGWIKAVAHIQGKEATWARLKE
jgi:hypothetical protein